MLNRAGRRSGATDADLTHAAVTHQKEPREPLHGEGNTCGSALVDRAHGAWFSAQACCSRNFLTSSLQGSGAFGSAGVKSLCPSEKSSTAEVDARPLHGE